MAHETYTHTVPELSELSLSPLVLQQETSCWVEPPKSLLKYPSLGSRRYGPSSLLSTANFFPLFSLKMVNGGGVAEYGQERHSIWPRPDKSRIRSQNPPKSPKSSQLKSIMVPLNILVHPIFKDDESFCCF